MIYINSSEAKIVALKDKVASLEHEVTLLWAQGQPSIGESLVEEHKKRVYLDKVKLV